MLAVLFAVLLPGCRATVSSAVSADWNGSGTFEVSMSMDRAAVEALEGRGIEPFGTSSGSSPATSTTAAPRAAPLPFEDLERAGWEVSSGGDTITFFHEFEGPGQLSALAAQVSGDAGPPLFPKMSLKVDAGVFRSDLDLVAVVNPTPELIVSLAGRGLEAPPSLAELERALGIPITEAVRFVFSVSLAGAEDFATDPSDAVEIRPGAWDVPIGSSLEVRASSETWTPAFWTALVSAGIAIILGIVLFLRPKSPG